MKADKAVCQDLAKKDMMAELQHKNSANRAGSKDRTQRRNLVKLPGLVGLVSFKPELSPRTGERPLITHAFKNRHRDDL